MNESFSIALVVVVVMSGTIGFVTRSLRWGLATAAMTTWLFAAMAAGWFIGGR